MFYVRMCDHGIAGRAQTVCALSCTLGVAAIQAAICVYNLTGACQWRPTLQHFLRLRPCHSHARRHRITPESPNEHERPPQVTAFSCFGIPNSSGFEIP